jgi:type IV pilus assembly protein PilQ
MAYLKLKWWKVAMPYIKNLNDTLLSVLLTLCMMVGAQTTFAAVTVDSIDYTVQSANTAQILITLSTPTAEKPYSFTIDNPARLAVDLPGTSLNLPKKNIAVDSGLIKSIRAVESGGRTRLVVSLLEVVPYEIRTENNQVFISLSGSGQAAGVTPKMINEENGANVNTSTVTEIRDIDFKRGIDGSSIVTVTMSNENAAVSVNEKGEKIITDFYNFKLPEKLSRRLDVTDFATPAQYVDFYPTSTGARMAITASGLYEHLAYQAGDKYTIELKPLTKDEAEEAKRDALGYSGEKLSLNFQNIEVRAVLQLIADFTGLNIVASDAVRGNITLRLKNVPWDQALDIILKTQGLGMRKSGNVVLVAPNKELAAREKEELQALSQKVDLSPLHTEFYTVSYAKAGDIAAILKAKENSILSSRGSVTVDKRTNTLMVLESAEKHEEVAKLVARLDVPIKQVMIESRIVIANDDFSRDLGVRTGVSGYSISGNDVSTVTGTATGANNTMSSIVDVLNGSATQWNYADQTDRYNFNLPAGGSSGSIGLAILGSDFLVDLELSALQTEGRGEVVSNPRVVTSNQTEAKIEQGVDIPYQEASSSGATSVSFKKAVLSLAVTPQITPDDRVIMDLTVNKDSVGGIYSGVPSINTRSVQTQVLVNNGDTVVLGGIYETSTAEGETKIPLLGDIPILGYLFRSTSKSNSKSELLIFVTPKILNDSLAASM